MAGNIIFLGCLNIKIKAEHLNIIKNVVLTKDKEASGGDHDSSVR